MGAEILGNIVANLSLAIRGEAATLFGNRDSSKGIFNMEHKIQCRCTKLQGKLSRPVRLTRTLCYCQDCQVFAHFLQRPADILNAQGGTDIIQTLPCYIHFSQGSEYLACVRLSPTGLLRWYASCCNTAIGNTLPDQKKSFVGLVHCCLPQQSPATLDSSFGPVQAVVNTAGASGQTPVAAYGLWRVLWAIIRMMLMARLSGGYKNTPFFQPQTGLPVVQPRVLSKTERHALQAAVQPPL